LARGCSISAETCVASSAQQHQNTQHNMQDPQFPTRVRHSRRRRQFRTESVSADTTQWIGTLHVPRRNLFFHVPMFSHVPLRLHVPCQHGIRHCRHNSIARYLPFHVPRRNLMSMFPRSLMVPINWKFPVSTESIGADTTHQ
jgi:hypothetical protein